jgi:nucleotide-binding universal stress UspA family protein
MKKHFLVTVSNDIDNLFGVRFLCSFFKKLSEHRITLLHICRQDSNDMAHSLNEMWSDPEQRVNGELTVGAKRCLDRSIELLAESRMAVDLLKTKTVAERYGKVKDILREGREGLYDAIVLGRRASYALQWLVERPADEIAQAMLQDTGLSAPLWICPDPGGGRKNVLVALDGSENALRAVDHVGYILANQEQHAITLFHVGGEEQAIFAPAMAILAEHGIGPERIGTKTTWGITVAGTLLSEAESGGYAAIALGMRGRDRSSSQTLGGSVTIKVLGKLEKAALWCCP